MSIRRYYDESIHPYLVWSKNLNIHFGYWRWGINPFRLENLLQQMNNEVLHRLQISLDSSPTILDVGCGSGAAMLHLAEAMPSAKFRGLTLSAQQIEMGKKIVEDAGLSNRISFYDADFESMPFEANSSDVAVLIESACYAEGADKSRLVDELARVLRPKSKVVIVDGFRRHSKSFSPLLEKTYRTNLQHWHLTQLADIQLFVKNMEQAGFKKIRVEDASWRIFPSVLYIPFVALRLLLINTSPAKKRYAKALLHTLLLGLFKKHFGYFIVTAELG